MAFFANFVGNHKSLHSLLPVKTRVKFLVNLTNGNIIKLTEELVKIKIKYRMFPFTLFSFSSNSIIFMTTMPQSTQILINIKTETLSGLILVKFFFDFGNENFAQMSLVKNN